MAAFSYSLYVLEGGLDLETPSFKQRLGNVLGILVSPRPLPQAGRAQVLVGGKLVLAYNLLKLSYGRDYRPNRLGLSPVWISTSLSHDYVLVLGIKSTARNDLTCLDSPGPARDSPRNSSTVSKERRYKEPCRFWKPVILGQLQNRCQRIFYLHSRSNNVS